MHAQTIDPRRLLTRWGGGQLLGFSGLDGQTDYEQGLTLRTAHDGLALEIMLPAQGCVLLGAMPPRAVCITGDVVELTDADGRRVRAALLDAYHLLVEGAEGLTEINGTLAVVQREGRLLIGVRAHMRAELLESDLDAVIAQRLAWLGRQRLPEGLSLPRRQTYAKVLSQIKTMVYAPEGSFTCRFTTPDRWPHRAVWLWDSAFHAVGLRHLDPVLAREAILAVIQRQRGDGFISITATPTSRYEGFTQPPTLAMAAMLIDEVAPDEPFLRSVFAPLERYIAWDLAERSDAATGLLVWAIEEHSWCRSGESGLDNSPRFDAASRLGAVDFTAFAAMECEALAAMATRLGDTAAAARWRAQQQRLNDALMRYCWDETLGFVCDVDLATGQRTGVVASTGFLALTCGALTPTQAARLAGHLRDAESFDTALPVASIAVRHRDLYSKDMWRGPVWMNINWLVVRGLRRYSHVTGLDALAEDVRQRSLDIVQRYYASHGCIFEFFDDRDEIAPPQLLRKKRNAPRASSYHQVMHDFGWTATLWLDLLLTGGRRCASAT